MSRDEDLSELNLSPAPRAVQSTGLASRRWALVMLVFGVVVGVVLGQLAALFRPDLMAWMTEPVSTPVISTPTQSSGPEAGEAGQAYGSGLSNPSAALASRGISASDMRVISRIQDLSEQIEALPTQFAPPTIHGVSGPQHPASWIESVGQALSGFFLIRKLSDSERFQLDATGYELAKRQIEQRLLAARLSVQMGEHGLARSDMSQATLLMARTLDPRDTEVLRAVSEAQAITDLLGQQP